SSLSSAGAFVHAGLVLFMILSTSTDLYFGLPSSSSPSGSEDVLVPKRIGTGKNLAYLSKISCRRYWLKNSSESALMWRITSVPRVVRVPGAISYVVLPSHVQCAGSAPSW